MEGVSHLPLSDLSVWSTSGSFRGLGVEMEFIYQGKDIGRQSSIQLNTSVNSMGSGVRSLVFKS